MALWVDQHTRMSEKNIDIKRVKEKEIIVKIIERGRGEKYVMTVIKKDIIII